MREKLLAGIHWLGQSSFRIEGDGLVIYIDPWQLTAGPMADLILISHEHQDHCSPDDVAKVRGGDTAVVANKTAAAKLDGAVEVVEPGDEVTVKGLTISAVAAYNINKFRSPGQPFHPQAAGHVGFVFTVGGRRIYFAGDTDHIPEMQDIQADVALLPVSGTYVMTAVEAAAAAATLQPQVAVPMHIGRGIGSMADAETFKQKAPVPVAVLAME